MRKERKRLNTFEAKKGHVSNPQQTSKDEPTLEELANAPTPPQGSRRHADLHDANRESELPPAPPIDNALPARVEETDLNSTQVARTAFEPAAQPSKKKKEKQGLFHFPPVKTHPLGCLARVLIILAFLAVLTGILAGSVLISSTSG